MTVDHADPGTPRSRREDHPRLQHGVGDVRRDQDRERRAVVGGATEHTLGGEREDDERHGDGADPQVGGGVAEHIVAGAEQPGDGCGGERRSPAQPVRRRARRSTSPAAPTSAAAVGSPCAEAAGDALGRAVGEEVAGPRRRTTARSRRRRAHRVARCRGGRRSPCRRGRTAARRPGCRARARRGPGSGGPSP